MPYVHIAGRSKVCARRGAYIMCVRQSAYTNTCNNVISSAVPVLCNRWRTRYTFGNLWFSIPQEKTSVNTKWNVWCARTSIQNPHEEGICGLGVLPQRYIEILTFWKFWCIIYTESEKWGGTPIGRESGLSPWQTIKESALLETTRVEVG